MVRLPSSLSSGESALVVVSRRYRMGRGRRVSRSPASRRPLGTLTFGIGMEVGGKKVGLAI